MKKKLNKDIAELLKEFVLRKTKEKLTTFYTGKIINNSDPEKLGRCRIRVFGIYGKEIPDDDLPWAIPDFNFIGSTIGSFIVPPEGAIVKVFFDNGDIYVPRYTTKVIDANNISSEAGDDYPDTMVFFETDEGEYFKINRKTNETTYRTATGVMITVDDEGSINISSEDTETGNTDITLKGNITITCSGASVVASGDVSVEAEGDVSVDADGSATVSSSGNATVESTTGDIEISSSLGSITLNTILSGAWKPCMLPNCLFTGAPHGDVAGALTKLKG